MTDIVGAVITVSDRASAGEYVDRSGPRAVELLAQHGVSADVTVVPDDPSEIRRGIRTAIELSVLLIGWMMGGKFGVGTVLYALTIGPLIQLCLPWFHQPVARKALAKPGEAIS